MGGPWPVLGVALGVTATLTAVLLGVACRFSSHWGEGRAFQGLALMVDLFDVALDWASLALTSWEGDLTFANDPDEVLMKALLAISIIGLVLFLCEAAALLCLGHVSRWVFVLHIGLEDLTQIVLYSIIAGLRSDDRVGTQIGIVVGVAQSLIFFLMKVSELMAGEMCCKAKTEAEEKELLEQTRRRRERLQSATIGRMARMAAELRRLASSSVAKLRRVRLRIRGPGRRRPPAPRHVSGSGATGMAMVRVEDKDTAAVARQI